MSSSVLFPLSQEERASQYEQTLPGSPYSSEELRTAHVNGAKQQREIDIQTAQKAHCKVCGEDCVLASYCADLETIREEFETE